MTSLQAAGTASPVIHRPDSWIQARPVSVASALAAASLIAYLCQVAFFGPIRYVLVTSHLEMLWYMPDALGFACLFAVWARDLFVRRSFRVHLYLTVIGIYLFEGYVVSGSMASVLSTFKALLPLFCGLLLEEGLLQRPVVKRVLLVFLLTACIGVAYSLDNPLPWADLQFDAIGIAQQFKATQWTYGGDLRPYGFGGDQHGAASSIVTLLILLSASVKRRNFYVLAAIAAVAVYFTTSRTNLATCLTFIALYTVVDRRRDARQQPVLRWTLSLSFLAFLVPIAVIGFALWFSAAEVPRSLLSLWARGTVSWITPFEYMNRLAPWGMIHGSGLGGAGFGLRQSDIPYYYTPVDNFILFNFLSFGLPYVLFYIHQCRRLGAEAQPYRVVIYIVMTVTGLTLVGWTDYLFMVLYGYATASVFRSVPRVNAKRAGRASAVNSGAEALRAVR